VLRCAVRLRVAFDGRTLTSPAGGVRRYVSELFSAMHTAVPDVDIVAIGADRGVAVPAGITAVRAGPSLPTNLGWSVSGLPIGAARSAADVFHATAYTAPLWGGLRRRLLVAYRLWNGSWGAGAWSAGQVVFPACSSSSIMAGQSSAIIG